MAKSSGKRKVLFIDDEGYRLTYYVEAVESAGYAIAFCDSAADGLDYLRERYAELDVVVLDIMMPTPLHVDNAETNEGQDTGIWLLRQARELIVRNKLPVIILSNRAKPTLEELVPDQVSLPAGLVVITSKGETSAMKLPELVAHVCKEWRSIGRSQEAR